MPNLPVAFDLDTPAAPVEISINGGTSWTPLTVTANGIRMSGSLPNVPATTYATNALQVRAVGYPTSMKSNGAPVTILQAVPVAAFVLTGQSNALAVGTVAVALASPAFVALNPAMLRQYAKTNIIYLGTTPATSTGTLQPLFPPTTASGTGSTGNNMAAGDGAYTVAAPNGPSFGQETVFPYLYNRERPTENLIVSKRTADGQPISVWSGTGGVTAKQVADFAAAQTQAGAPLATKVFTWIQGEANSGDPVASYQAALAAVLQAYRDGGVIQPTTKIALVGIKAGGNTDTAKQNLAAADTTGNTFFVSTLDLATNEGVHYTSLAHLTLGERIYNGAFGTTTQVLPTTPPPAAATGVGLALTGGSGAIATPSASLNITGSVFKLEMTYRRDINCPAACYPFSFMDPTNIAADQYSFFTNPSNTTSFYTSQSGTQQRFFPVIADDLFHSISLTSTASGVVLTQDGAAGAAFAAINITPVTSGLFYLANRPGGAVWEGTIKTLRITNNGVLVAAYDFTTGNALDSSGNGNHLTLSGSYAFV